MNIKAKLMSAVAGAAFAASAGAAQAEITRLSILLEESGQPGSTDAQPATADSAQRLTRLTADAERLEAENARLRAELHSNDAFMSMRRELSDLAASVMASLEGEADTAQKDKSPAAPGNARTAPEPSAGNSDEPADPQPGKDTQTSHWRARLSSLPTCS